TPDRMADYAKSAGARGLKAIIAGAGGAAHLPGMVASMTTLPVLGVPVESRALKGLDSLLSIAQMPGGVPVATFAIGEAGAKNAALFAAAILALENPDVAGGLAAFRARQTRGAPRLPSPGPPRACPKPSPRVAAPSDDATFSPPAPPAARGHHRYPRRRAI